MATRGMQGLLLVQVSGAAVVQMTDNCLSPSNAREDHRDRAEQGKARPHEQDYCIV